MPLPRLKPWLPEHGPTDIVFTNANVVDVVDGVTLSGRTIHISEGTIISVSVEEDNKASLAGSDQTTVVDLEGKYLMPGLIDCHVHLTATAGEATMRDLYAPHPNTIAYRTVWNAKEMLLRGFTTVRDTGGADFALRDAISEGLVPGPRLFFAGKALSQTGGHADMRSPQQDDSFKCCGGNQAGIGRILDGVPAALSAARDELRKGADFLKIMAGGGVASPADPLEMIQFTADEIQAITSSARSLGKYVTAHAYTNEAIRHAIDNGVMGIEHGNFIDGPTAKLCAEKGVFVTPTLVVYNALITPPYEEFLPESGRIKCKQVMDSGVEALTTLYENGVTMCYGTDLLAGMHVLQNREFSIRAGVLPAVEVLRSATVNAAKLLGMQGKLGTVREGAIADLLVVDRDPLEDVRVLDDMEKSCFGIVKEGRVVMSKLSGLEIDGVYS